MISLVTPTRGRPEAFQLMSETAHSTAKGPIEILTCLQKDDVRLNEYDFEPTLLHPGTKNIGKLYNELVQYASGDILVFAGDDMIFKTDGWDLILEEHMPSDGIAVLSFDDGRGGDKPCPHPTIGRRFYETLGFFTIWHIRHWGGDTFLEDLGKAIDRYIWIPEIVVQHRKNFDAHYNKDRGTKSGTNPNEDKEIYESLKRNGFFHEQVDKLRRAIDDYKNYESVDHFGVCE